MGPPSHYMDSLSSTEDKQIQALAFQVCSSMLHVSDVCVQQESHCFGSLCRCTPIRLILISYLMHVGSRKQIHTMSSIK